MPTSEQNSIRYWDFCHTKSGNFSLDGEMIFVTKKVANHCLHQSKNNNSELGFLSQKKWQFKPTSD